MPTFTYKALDLNGRDVAGRQDATSRSELVRELASRGLAVTEMDESKGWPLSTPKGANAASGGRIGRKQLQVITRQLAVSLEAGLPLMSALEVMSQELEHAPTKAVLDRLRQRVQEGVSFSEALAEYPNTFAPMYVRMVRVGETGGMLDAVLKQLADMLERNSELRERVKSASVYPAIVMVLGIVSVVIIVSFIVPKIVESIGVDESVLPWPTRVMLGASHLVENYWHVLIIGVAALIIGWRQMVLRGPWRPKWDGFKLRTPILGRLIRQLEASRFARSLGMLASGGVSITEALAVARDTIQNVVVREAGEDLANAIHAGESIAKPLQRSGQFPPLLVQMVRVGENTGRLGEMLLRSADVHESEARITLDRFVSILPIGMILVLAGVIGFIIAGLVLAIIEFQTLGAAA